MARVSVGNITLYDVADGADAGTLLFRQDYFEEPIPTNTTEANALVKTFGLASYTGRVAIHVKIKDAEGSVNVSFNGNTIGTGLTGPDQAIKSYYFYADAIGGNNTLAFWANALDGSQLVQIEVTAVEKGDAGIDPVFGYIEIPSGTNDWTRNKDGTLTPAGTTSFVRCQFVRGGANIGMRQVRADVRIDNTIDIINNQSTGEATTFLLVNDGTKNPLVIFEHIDSGAKQVANFRIAVEGEDGEDGTDGRQVTMPDDLFFNFTTGSLGFIPRGLDPVTFNGDAMVSTATTTDVGTTSPTVNFDGSKNYLIQFRLKLLSRTQLNAATEVYYSVHGGHSISGSYVAKSFNDFIQGEWTLVTVDMRELVNPPTGEEDDWIDNDIKVVRIDFINGNQVGDQFEIDFIGIGGYRASVEQTPFTSFPISTGAAQIGGQSNLVLELNRFNGVDNAGEITHNAYTLIKPDGTVVSKPALQMVTAFEDDKERKFFFMYSDVEGRSRFTSIGNDLTDGEHIIPVVAEAGLWKAVGNSSVTQTFTPLSTDVFLAVGQEGFVSALGEEGISRLEYYFGGYSPRKGIDYDDGLPGAGFFGANYDVPSNTPSTITSRFTTLVGRAPAFGDIFTQSNNDFTVSIIKLFNGTTWEDFDTVFPGSILAKGSIIGDRIAAGSEISAPKVKGGSILSSGGGSMIYRSATPFGSDNLIEWYGSASGKLDVNGDPILTSMTKSNGTHWLAANGDKSRDIERKAVVIDKDLTVINPSNIGQYLTIGTLSHETLKGTAELEFRCGRVSGLLEGLTQTSGTATIVFRIIDNTGTQIATVSNTLDYATLGLEPDARVSTDPDEPPLSLVVLDNNSSETKYLNKNYRLQVRLIYTGQTPSAVVLDFGADELFKSLEVAP